MPLTCPKCSRVNPVDGWYCYFDGSALRDHGRRAGAADAGMLVFPIPIVFPSGHSFRSFDQLALGCLDHWSMAVEMFQQGDLASFMAGLGRADLAQAAREAARFPDRDRGLDQFLAKLPTQTVKPPQLQVEPRQVNLGQLRIGEDHQWELHLANQGMRLLYGSVTCVDCVWLALGDGPGASQKLFQFTHEAVIPVHVRGKHLRASNQLLEGRLVIESNGGNVTVVVSAEVPIQPFAGGVLAGARSPRQVAEKAKASPREAASLFENGAVARWYQANGWIYPVQGPSASGLGAVQQFFEALGLTAPPRVKIREQYIHFQGNAGEQLGHTVEVQAQEKRPVYAHAVSDQPWLEVSRVKLDGRTGSIRLTVPVVPNRPGEVLQAHLTVTANGNQRFVLPVMLAVGGRYRPGEAQPILDVLQVPQPAIPTAVLAPVAARVSRPSSVAAIPVALPAPTEAPQILDAVPAALPDAEQPRRSGWLPLLPVAFLIVGLLITVIRDIFKKADTPDVVVVEEGLLDPAPRIALHFHDQPIDVTLGLGGIKPEAGQVLPEGSPAVWEPSMRFGLVMLREKDPRLGGPKRLTFEERGLTNNTCIRLDGNEWLFGERPFRRLDGRQSEQWPGHWKEREVALGKTSGGRTRQGAKSIWLYADEQVVVTQTVEIVAGEQSRLLDTCLVRYLIENCDSHSHQVGLRFLLDTYIGANDGVPFTIPGAQQLCDSMREFDRPDDVPDFIQALEHEDLAHPGTIAHVQLRLGGRLEPPDHVTLGAWPNTRLATQDPRCRQEKTLWDVPVLPIKTLTPADSAVTIYWNERPLNAGESREVGFAYGLGTVSSGEGHGKLALTIGGSFTPDGEFTVTAYVSNPIAGETITLVLPDGFHRIDGDEVQAVPPLPAHAASRNSPVTWKVKAPPTEGKFTLKVQSSTGVSQSQDVTIKSKRIFD